MNNRPTTATYLLRRELIEHYEHMGLSIRAMLTKLDDQGLFAPTQNYAARYAATRRIIDSIKRENASRHAVTEEASRREWRSYIDRTTFLYYQALREGNLALAGQFSKDIARAFGVETDAPVQVQTNLLATLQAAVAAAQAKREAEQSKE
jgi:hypothetical protein